MRSQVGMWSVSDCLLGQLDRILGISDSEAGVKEERSGSVVKKRVSECGGDAVRNTDPLKLTPFNRLQNLFGADTSAQRTVLPDFVQICSWGSFRRNVQENVYYQQHASVVTPVFRLLKGRLWRFLAPQWQNFTPLGWNLLPSAMFIKIHLLYFRLAYFIRTKVLQVRRVFLYVYLVYACTLCVYLSLHAYRPIVVCVYVQYTLV